MKKSELIKIIKEEISNILSENEGMLASMPDDLESMSKEEMISLGAAKLFSLYNAQCESDESSEKCNLAREVYRSLNPTGSI